MHQMYYTYILATSRRTSRRSNNMLSMLHHSLPQSLLLGYSRYNGLMAYNLILLPSLELLYFSKNKNYFKCKRKILTCTHDSSIKVYVKHFKIFQSFSVC